MGRALVVVGDDAGLAEQLASALTADGYVVVRAANLASARAALQQAPVDLIVVERILADGDGLLLCAEGGEDPTLVVVLAPSGTAAERIACLRAGADDCMQRPLDVEEVRTRIAAMFRRAAPHADMTEREGRIELTARESSVLACLVERANQPITPAALLSRTWAFTFDPRAGTLVVERSHAPRSTHHRQQPRRAPEQAQHHSDVFPRAELDGRRRSRS